VTVRANEASTTGPAAISEAEWKARVDLAAAYRISAHLGWEYLIYNHIAMRVPGEPCFLIKPHEVLFSEVRASELVKLRLDGKAMSFGDNVNPAGFVIHTAVLNARPDIHCTLHVHTTAGMAMSAHKRGLLPLTQNAMQFYNRLSYHDFEGFATEADEAKTLAHDLGPKNLAMVLRNHGLLTCGASGTEAVRRMWALVLSCESQLMLEATGAEITMPPPEVCEHSARQGEGLYASVVPQDRAAFARILERIDGSYKT
jgi:ribulose-5-phosphate 4-epimerase/fuculose-1-phosphate aldolase